MLGKSDCEHVLVSLPVRQRFGDAEAVPCLMTSLALDCATLEQCGARLGESRYVWLDFVLPDGNERTIRALGEVATRDAERDVYRVRFKHLFPDHRRRVESFLRSRVATSVAA